MTRKIHVFNFTILMALVFPALSWADGVAWTFTTETVVDTSVRFTSLAVDGRGDVHLAYTNSGDRVNYAFRDARTSKWFNTELDSRASFTSLTLDSHGDPNVCYTQQTIRYAYWDGSEWHKEQISPGSGTIAFYCSVAVSADGIPHVTWYQERTAEDTNFLHLRHAVLQDGQWLAKTIDWDAQTGKWHSMVLDKQGTPRVSFDAFVSGQLKYGIWVSGSWKVKPIDSRTSSQQPGRGMGNCLILDSDGRPMISYFEDGALKYARQKENGSWSIETLASTSPSPSWAGYRTSQALDNKGLPHLVYEDAGVLRHMYWDGKTWHKQTIVTSGAQRFRYASIAIGSDNTIYISYCDPDDGSLKVAVGHAAVSTGPDESEKKTAP